MKGDSMSDQQDYEKLLPKLKAIEDKAVRRPDMPIEQAIKEGGIMATAAQEDTKPLNAANVVTVTINELGSSVAALRYAQAQFTAAIGEVKGASRKWNEEEPNAIKLRRDLLKTMTYALRKVLNATRTLAAIRKGSGNPDMLKDLSALVSLGRKYPAELKAVNYDLSQLDAAEAKTNMLNTIYSQAYIEKKTVEYTQLRDRAFTYMRMMMGEILDAAEYVFRDDPKRLDLYYSSYRSRQTDAADGQDTSNTGPAQGPETPGDKPAK